MPGPEIQDALRACLTRCFTALTTDLSEAAQLQAVLDELACASRSILSDLVSDWNQRHGLLHRLPNEIVAYCFGCLPFRDRLTVTHVSRGWRLLALAHRNIWTKIVGAVFKDKSALLQMALERAGHLPVVIRNCADPDRSGMMADILLPHLSHIRHLELPAKFSAAGMNSPAPHLRFLQFQSTCRIREDFLGGRVGQLQTLELQSVIFPPMCPALSTVTSLTLHAPLNRDHATTYYPLFRLFPALQSLSLLGVEYFDIDFVPDGQAPPSLRRLVLETWDMRFDVCKCYAFWTSIAQNRSDVMLTQFTAPSRDLYHLFSGAVELVIGSEDIFSQIIAVGPGERRRVLNLWTRCAETDAAIQSLVDVRSSFTGVHSFDITSAQCAPMLAVLPALPNLAHLTVTREYEDPQLWFQEVVVSLLSRLPEHCPGLQTMTICVERHGRPARDVASALLAELEALGHIGLPDVLVQGFTREDIRGLQLPRFDGFRVIFAPEAGST